MYKFSFPPEKLVSWHLTISSMSSHHLVPCLQFYFLNDLRLIDLSVPYSSYTSSEILERFPFD